MNITQKSGQSLRNFRCIADTQILLMYTMWTHLNGRKIVAAYYLQVKLWGYQGYSILTLLSREKGKMFTNLTEPEKSEGRKKVRWQMTGRGLEGRERPVERKRERREALIKPLTTQGYSASEHTWYFIRYTRCSLCSTTVSLSSLTLLPQKVLEVNRVSAPTLPLLPGLSPGGSTSSRVIIQIFWLHLVYVYSILFLLFETFSTKWWLSSTGSRNIICVRSSNILQTQDNLLSTYYEFNIIWHTLHFW